MKPRVIVTAGMQGSGSTWLYNAVRYAFLNAGFTVYGVFAPAYDPQTPAQIHVVKIHDYDPKWRPIAEKILMTRRSIFDCAASCVAKGLVKDEPIELLAFMTDLKDSSEKWKAEADLVVDYINLHCNAYAAMLSVLACLDIPCYMNKHERIEYETLRDLDNLTRTINNHVDHVTHFWPNHIQDGGINTYRKRLSPESIALLEKAFDEA